MWPGPGSPRRKAVLLITHEHSTGDASLRYRSAHHAESLGLLGVSCDVARYGQVGLLEAVDDYECVVLHRVPWEAAEPFVVGARERGQIVVTDTDDLVFDAAEAQDIEAVEDMSEAWRAAWTTGFRRTIAACSAGAIASTEPLAERLREITRPVFTLPNVASEEMVLLAERARRSRRPSSGEQAVTLGYFSGSLTHRRDFDEAVDAVLETLEHHPRVRFTVVGHLEFDARFDRFASRVTHVAWHPWQTLFELYAETDVNLAPLAANPFSTCKSAVKYVEAALVGVPTVASTRADFARVIDHNRTGLLADGHASWREALQRLVEDHAFRVELGENALRDVLAHQTTVARLGHVEKMWQSLVAARGRSDRPMTVDWLVGPEVSDETLDSTLRLARALAARGHIVRLCAEGASLRGEWARHPLADSDTGSATLELADFHRLTPVDARIATDAQTAHHLSHQHSALFRFRLVVRNDEVGFDFPVRHVCLDEDVGERIRARSGRDAHLLDLAGGAGEALERFLDDACFVRLSGRGE